MASAGGAADSPEIHVYRSRQAAMQGPALRRTEPSSERCAPWSGVPQRDGGTDLSNTEAEARSSTRGWPESGAGNPVSKRGLFTQAVKTADFPRLGWQKSLDLHPRHKQPALNSSVTQISEVN